MILGIYLTNDPQAPVHLPGLVITDNGETPAKLSYSRYLGDETLREQVNSLYDRGAVNIYVADEEADLPDNFPVRTEAEMELRRHPIVPEMGGMFVLSEEPMDAALATGQGAIWITNDAVHGLKMLAKSRGVAASLEQGQINYISRRVGQYGNQVSVVHVTPDLENTDASVEVDGKHISVILGTSGDAVAAGVDVGSGDSGFHVRARALGVAGNDLSLVLIGLDADEHDTTLASVGGDEILINLAQTARLAAKFSTSAGANKDMTATATILGTDGNNLRVGFVPDDDSEFTSGGWDGDFAYTRNGTDIHLRSKTGATAADMVTWAATNPAEATGDATNLHDYMTVALKVGSNGSGAVPNVGNTSLTGGAEGAITTTALALKNAIEADAGANGLVAVTLLGNGSGVIDADDSGQSFALTGGVDADIPVSQAADVVNLLQASPAAMALVSVEIAGSGDAVVDSMDSPEYLSGGSDTDILRATIWQD